MSDDAIIRVEAVWKRYGFPLAAHYHRAMNALRSSWARKTRGRDAAPHEDDPWSLRDVSFQMMRGETLGIIGRNGAGKSTLLKILAGVTPPTRGRVAVSGRIFPMIELNAGIHPELTGRENVRLLGAVMGIERHEFAARMPEVEKFCELGEWFDRPVRKYSSGMMARLGFGVAMNVQADILLIDEVLAVGDFAFQKKCINEMSRISSDGTTIVFVSHSPYLLERMCDRVVFMDNGTMEELGEPSEVIHRYFEMVSRDTEKELTREKPTRQRQGSGDLRIEKVEILDHTGATTDQVSTDEPMTIRLHYVTREAQNEPNFSIRVYDPQNTIVVAFDSTLARQGITLSGSGTIDCTVPTLPLMPNLYTIAVKCSCDLLQDVFENAASFKVVAGSETLVKSGSRGIVYANAQWRF